MMHSTPTHHKAASRVESVDLSTPHAVATTVDIDEAELPTESPLSPMLQAVEPEVANADDEEAETIELPSDGVAWPNDPSSGGLYSNALWHGVPRVLQQAEAGRAANKALISLVRGKAELDREYATKLRALADTYSRKLALPARPRAANTFQAACCAVRNLHVNIAANSETLADQIDEQVADVFADEASELSSVLKPLMASTNATLARYNAAMATLEQTKRDLARSCQELNDAKQGTQAASDPMDFLTQMIRSTPESLTRKVAERDSAHVQQIKRARELRGEHDSAVTGHLAELEALETKRMTKSLTSMSALTRILNQCYTSHLKNIGAVLHMLQTKIRPVEDLRAFVQDTIRDARGLTKPPPLPVYRLVKGHPNFARKGGARKRGSGMGAAAGAGDSDSDAVDEPTDSEDDNETSGVAGLQEDDSEEITLSGTEETSDASQESGNESGDEPNTHDSIHAAVAARSSSKSFSLTSAQTSSIRSTLASLASLPAFSTSSAASPVVLEPERSQAVEACTTEKGRMEVARELKRMVKAAGGQTANASTSEETKEDAETATDESGSAASRPLLLSSAAIDGLTSFLTAMFDAATPSMHVQPIRSVMRSAKLILCSEGDASGTPTTPSKAPSAMVTPSKGKGKKGRKSSQSSPPPSDEKPASPEADAASSSSSSSPSSSLYSHLLLHPIFSLPRYYELSFLSLLDRTWKASKDALVQRWHTDKEAKERAGKQRALAGELLLKSAREAEDMGRVDAQTIVAFVSKMSATNSLDAEVQAQLVAELQSFRTLGLDSMPQLAGSAKALVSGAAPSPTAATGGGNTVPSSAASLPVAQPVQVASKK